MSKLSFVVFSVCTMLFVSNESFAAKTKKTIRKPSAAKTVKALPKKTKATKEVPSTDARRASPTNEQTDDMEVEKLARKSPVNVDSKNSIRVNYGRREWNADPAQIDTAILYLREGKTGRVVQIEVEETTPDSATFSGLYSINWRNIEGLQVAFYAPPKKLLADMNGRMQIAQMIETKELKKLPFVLRRDPVTGVQNIELFDNIEQARLAYRSFVADQELLVAMKNQLEKRDQTLDTAQLALEKAEREEAMRNHAERMRIGQIETQRLTSLMDKYSLSTPANRATRKAQALALADQAMADYKAGRLQEARINFEKAVDLDPTNRTYYFQYGVALYKLDDFNKSLVYLDLAEGKSVDMTERDFYRGLNFYRLKDSSSALAAFKKVIDAKDPVISPSARFYSGLLHFERKRWSDARTEFQGVLDESNDPSLDERSETYLENILRQQQFEAERAKKWTITGTIGEMYDDNVLLSSDSDRDRGAATNLEAYRAMLIGSARYRPIYEETSEFAVQLDFLTQMSVDKNLQVVQAITNADATVAGLTLPWTHKGMFLGKGHKFDFVPGYEMTYMSIENNEFKMIYNSYSMGFQNLFIMNELWFTSVNLDIRKDMSLLASSTGDNDSTAMKSKLSWSNINLLEDKKRIILSDFAYTVNSAQGKNSVYNRMDLGLGYVRPFYWDTTMSSKLSYFNLTYPQNTNGRIDNGYTAMVSLTKKLSEKITVNGMFSYNINSSNVTANQYKKGSFLLTLTYSDAF